MLIGIDASRAISPAPTGTETYSCEIIRALLQLDRENSYRLYTRAPVPREFFSAQSPTFGVQSPKSDVRRPASDHELRNTQYAIRSLPFPRAWTHARLSYEMLAHAPDVLWVPAHVLPAIHPRRSIVTVHDLGQFYFPEAYPPATRLYHFWSTRWNARAASHIFADSLATKNDLMRFCQVAPEKISVVYPAYDAQLYQPVRDAARIEAVREKYHVGIDYIITVGTIHPRKNYTQLLDAFASLRPETWNLKLVIVGKRGWLYDEIFKQTQSLRLSISFLEYVPPEDLPSLLSGARAFVFPSLHEGFGLPILEAQACGVPVICSNTSSLPEAAGQGALLVDPRDEDAIADGIARVLSDRALREELIARGFENVKRFSWEESAGKVQRVLSQKTA
ncbi:MAG: glycosyltransferase family 4 protein [Chloroflexi bacterium]|nr:glycosyltransferase family 4 protein [Chloroflexota bacterium]